MEPSGGRRQDQKSERLAAFRRKLGSSKVTQLPAREEENGLKIPKLGRSEFQIEGKGETDESEVRQRKFSQELSRSVAVEAAEFFEKYRICEGSECLGEVMPQDMLLLYRGPIR